jgi:mannose-6-phosphate isomerase
VTPRRIIGVEKNYDWGDEITIRHTLGNPSERGTKVAELWWGTHPQGPSHLDTMRGGPRLQDVAGEMTMLVKLLACAQPLSLQTHPTAQQAREGFAREEELGIPRDAPQRMYKDESDKPEMIIALSRFEALCGFAPIDNSVRFLRSIGWRREAKILASTGISDYLKWAFQQDKRLSFWRAPKWMKNLRFLHPNDPALRVVPLLNHVVLDKGEALALPAGNLHAYLHGFGLEVMNSSDNVIRAGFTSKHVDVNELLRIVDTTPLLDPVVHVDANGMYSSPSSEFTVGLASVVDNYEGHHRIAFGQFGDWVHNLQRPMHAEPVFIEAGTRADFPIHSGYVCIQN